jgi:hypothetical protein
VPEGLLAARIAPGASITELFERISDCIDGAVGLWPQAPSSGIMESRGDSFIEAPVEGIDQRLALTAALAASARAAEVHFGDLGGADHPTFAACTHTFTAE